LQTRFKDHFSGHAGQYATYRPQYPDALFRFLADSAAARTLAWDCATGNGQAARGLAPFFDRVVATDASDRQIAAAVPMEKVEFRTAAAEASGLDPESVDLLTVAQALHWFDIPRFFTEAQRVLKPGGLLAVWSYARNRVNDACDPIVSRMFAEVEDFWPPERLIVENHYRDIVMPVAELPAPQFEMKVCWSVDQALGYFRTWSASQRYRRERKADPVAVIEQDLRRAWGDGRLYVYWPLTLRLGRK
jgi:SAM-dependent methyltransferase